MADALTKHTRNKACSEMLRLYILGKIRPRYRQACLQDQCGLASVTTKITSAGMENNVSSIRVPCSGWGVWSVRAIKEIKET